MVAPSQAGVARTLGAPLGGAPTPLRALNRRTLEPGRLRIASSPLGFLPVCPKQTLRGGVTVRAWYRAPHEVSPHPGVSPYKCSNGTLTSRQRKPSEGRTRLCQEQSLGLFDVFIPVVTFLAPLASNFEGLKDR